MIFANYLVQRFDVLRIPQHHDARKRRSLRSLVRASQAEKYGVETGPTAIRLFDASWRSYRFARAFLCSRYGGRSVKTEIRFECGEDERDNTQHDEN